MKRVVYASVDKQDRYDLECKLSDAILQRLSQYGFSVKALKGNPDYYAKFSEIEKDGWLNKLAVHVVEPDRYRYYKFDASGAYVEIRKGQQKYDYTPDVAVQYDYAEEIIENPDLIVERLANKLDKVIAYDSSYGVLSKSAKRQMRNK